jgi:general stress protein 26
MARPQFASDSTAEAMGHLHEIISKFDTAMLITRRPGSEFHGRPMAIAQVDDDGALWFVTSIDAQKLIELSADPSALVCMQGSSRFATINGKVDVVRDPEKVDEVWKETFRVWFDGKHDPKLVLLRLTPFEGEYWDQSGIRGLKYAFRAAKALLRDERVETGREDPDTHANLKL